MKSLEVSEEKANQRVEEFKRQLKSLTIKLKEAENRAELAEKTVKKLQKEVDRLEGKFLEQIQEVFFPFSFRFINFYFFFFFSKTKQEKPFFIPRKQKKKYQNLLSILFSTALQMSRSITQQRDFGNCFDFDLSIFALYYKTFILTKKKNFFADFLLLYDITKKKRKIKKTTKI